jgi:hypothetical protein
MYIAIATVADFASTTNNGTTLVNARTIVATRQLPARLQNLCLFVSIAAEPADYGQTCTAQLSVLDPEEQPFIETPEFSVHFPPPEEEQGISTINLGLNTSNQEFQKSGIYKVSVIVQNRTIHTFVFSVIEKEQPS